MASRTVYTEDFVEHPFKSIGNYDPICEELFKKDTLKKYLTSKTDSIIAGYSQAEKDQLIKNRWDRFYKTIYRKGYCQKPVKADKIISEGVLMMEMEKLFKDSEKDYLMPRAPLAEKVMGYASKGETQTPLTTYQNSYDRVGYFVIKTNKERVAKKEADKHRVSIADRVPSQTSRTKPGEEKIGKKKSYSSTSTNLDQQLGKKKSNNDIDSHETKQFFFLAPDNTSETQPLTFEFDTKNKNVIQLE